MALKEVLFWKLQTRLLKGNMSELWMSDCVMRTEHESNIVQCAVLWKLKNLSRLKTTLRTTPYLGADHLLLLYKCNNTQISLTAWRVKIKVRIRSSPLLLIACPDVSMHVALWNYILWTWTGGFLSTHICSLDNVTSLLL